MLVVQVAVEQVVDRPQVARAQLIKVMQVARAQLIKTQAAVAEQDKLAKQHKVLELIKAVRAAMV
jgi:hypothetical protein